MRDWRAYTGKELFELTTNLDSTIERQGQMIVKQAEELQDHERVMKLLRDRFPIREDGSHADYAVEDVLAENQRQAEELQAIANKIHYPDCWDSMAYPTLLDAVHECYDGCSQCGGGFVDGMQS